MSDQKYTREYFDTHIQISHRPTGYKFYQSGGQIVVLSPRDDGIYQIFASFTTTELQIEGTHLTEATLRKAAVTWMKDQHS